MRSAWWLLPCCAVLGSCIEMFEPDVGPPVRDICRNEDSDPEVDVSFYDDILVGIFADDLAGCNDCHLPNAVTPIGFEIGGLDLSDYSTLRQGGTQSGASIVVDGQPCESILWQKVTQGPPFGGRMPLDGPPFVSPENIQKLNDWIAEGAREN